MNYHEMFVQSPLLPAGATVSATRLSFTFSGKESTVRYEAAMRRRTDEMSIVRQGNAFMLGS